MDEDAELVGSGARGDVALRMPPPPGQQTLSNPTACPPDERRAEPSGASSPPAAVSGANPNPNFNPGRSAADPLAASGSPGFGDLGGPLVPKPVRPGGGPGRPGIAASMPAAVARGGAIGGLAGAERRRDARSTEALGVPHAQTSPGRPAAAE